MLAKQGNADPPKEPVAMPPERAGLVGKKLATLLR
jgi:hypothetical protein